MKLLFNQLENKYYEPDGSGGGSDGQQPDMSKLNDKVNYLDSELKKVIKERDEAKGKLRSIEDEDKIKKGEFEKLANERQAEVDKLKNEIESLKPKVSEYENFLNAEREQLKKEIGDNWDDSYATLPLPALRKLAKSFSIPGKVADTDGGKGKGSHETKTELEKKLEVARQNGSPLHIILALERQIQEQQK